MHWYRKAGILWQRIQRADVAIAARIHQLVEDCVGSLLSAILPGETAAFQGKAWQFMHKFYAVTQVAVYCEQLFWHWE